MRRKPATSDVALALACSCAIGLAGACGSSASGSGGATTVSSGATGGDDPISGLGGMQATCTGGATSGGSGGSGGANSGCDGVFGAAHFASDVGPILAACTGELCHLPPGYADVVSVPSEECCDGRLIVKPFDAAHSYLLDKVKGEGLCYGGRMPFDAPPLSDAEVGAIARWICAGALDD
ncbi:MAG: hypothetical protein U0441_38545 [Polyangiaceae bacterium]